MHYCLYLFTKKLPSNNKILEIMKPYDEEDFEYDVDGEIIGGYPVEKHYDKFCEKYNGTKHVLKDAIKDKFGKYHNDVIYEIICN